VITDLLAPEAVADPHAVYRELREHSPVIWLPEHRAWFVGTYEGVAAAFRDQRLSSDRLTPLEARLSPEKRAVLGDTFDLLRGWMVFHDPPHHERLKAPVRRAFTPKAVESLRPFVERVVDECLDQVEQRLRDGERVDLVEHLAFPLPAIVIAELLGVPASDRDDFKHWSNELAAIVFGASSDPRQAERAAAGSAQFGEYFTALVAHYERHPADNLISALVAARELADPPLSSTELVGACTLLLFGGHETTTSLIGNATLSLLQHPQERAWLRDRSEDPAVVATALEELHRFDGSSKVMVRIAGETFDLESAGASSVTIEAGRTVFLGIASANRDPAMFDAPDRLDLQRSTAIKHLGFGVGLHFCLGAPLARLESQVAVGRFVARLPQVELAIDPGDLRWGSTILGRGLSALPVERR
jgi:cytochrome P450